jgi:uncharacterized membrane protein
MAKKIGKSYNKSGLQPEIQTFLGIDTHYIALMLYIGSSLVNFFQPSPFVPLVVWLLGLLTYQYCKQEFLGFHALQSAAINIIAVFLRFGISFVNSLMINQVVGTGGTEEVLLEQAQQMGWVSLGVTVVLLIAQIYGAETALRGLKKKIPLVHALGLQMSNLFFGIPVKDE